MKPAPFDYYAPDTIEEVLELLGEYGDEAKPLAGGQSLIPAMSFRLARPAILVDLGRLDGLTGICPLDGRQGGLAIGAMTTHRAVEHSDLVDQHQPLLAETMPHIAHPQIRNRGTLGGSLVHADPAAELPAVLLALGGSCRLRCKGHDRWVSAREFFTGLFETACAGHELLTEVSLPATTPRTGHAFEEVARRHGDYAMAGAAVRIQLDANGKCSDAAIVLFSVGEGPVEAATAVDQLIGEAPNDELITSVAHAAAYNDIDPPGDIHASIPYRRHLAEVMVRRCVSRAIKRAR